MQQRLPLENVTFMWDTHMLVCPKQDCTSVRQVTHAQAASTYANIIDFYE